MLAHGVEGDTPPLEGYCRGTKVPGISWGRTE